MNRVVIAGRIVATDALRTTPAGIPIVRIRIAHESVQIEAGVERKVVLEIGCVAVEREARLIAAAPLGAAIEVEGFIAARGTAGRQLELHITNSKFSKE